MKRLQRRTRKPDANDRESLRKRTRKPDAAGEEAAGAPGAEASFDEDRLYHERFSSLSVRDLLDARDTYHVHLIRKKNVIATAVGLFLIRRKDPDFFNSKGTPAAARQRGKLGERRLDNALARPWSWPCVLVFVRSWETQLAATAPQSVVPPFLYLQDGRIVPVCIVHARPADIPMRLIPQERLSAERLSGGSAIYALVQGQRRVGSVGCMVTDGAEYYALTNRHVAGSPGTPIQASVKGVGLQVGVSASTGGLGTESFSKMYPGFPGRETVAQVDAGLIRIDRVRDWSPRIQTIGRIGAMLDFNAETATLDWIGARTVACGAVSGRLEGEIRALFYRYSAVGGREYVSDFLIGARVPEKKTTKELPEFLPEHGDSGLVHCLDLRKSGEGVRPFALQWGGQKLSSLGTLYTQYALASSLGVICRELGLTIVSDWSTDNAPYWGAVGHFKIAQQACHQVENQELRAFLLSNMENITFADDASIWSGPRLDPQGFVPLADVPDVVWKGRKGAVRRAENTSHYADMDLPGPDGRTLFDICGKPARLDRDAWAAYYKAVKPPADAPRPDSGKARVPRGCLPFRVWQVFTAMKGFAEKGDAGGFLCAAGVMAHYVGDSCQPLHTSQHADGANGASAGVHATYENNMVQAYGQKLAEGVAESLKDGDWPLLPVSCGSAAGGMAVELARRCHGYLDPLSICRSKGLAQPGSASSSKARDVLAALWRDCGAGTVKCVADGIRVLASFWEAAFTRWPKGAEIPSEALDPDDLKALYSNTRFLESKSLEKLTAADLGS